MRNLTPQLISMADTATLDTPEPQSPRGVDRKPADSVLMASASDTNLSQPPRDMGALSASKSRASSMPGEAMAAREPTRHHRWATAPNIADLGGGNIVMAVNHSSDACHHGSQ